MNSILSFILTALLLTHLDSFSQSKFSERIGFSKSGGFAGGLIELNGDSGMLIAGSREFTSNNINHQSDGANFLLKTDKNGLPIWMKDYTVAGYPFMRFSEIVNYWNDSILFLAYSISRVPIIGTLQDHYFFGKMDTSGNVGMVKEFHYTSSDAIRNVHVTKDSGFVLCGITSTNYSFWDTSSTRPPSNSYLMKLDKNMNQQWCRKYGDSTYFFADASAKLPDEGFIIAGRSTVMSDTAKLCILRTDSLGNVIWCKVEQSATEVVGGRMFITIGKDSSIAIAYDSGSPLLPFNDISFAKLDMDGNLIWHRLQGEQGGDAVDGLIATSDSGFILLTRNLLRFYDNNGSILYGIYQNTGYAASYYSMIKNQRGNLVLAGGMSFPVNEAALTIKDTSGFSCADNYYSNLSSLPTSFVLTDWAINDTLIPMLDSIRMVSNVMDTLPIRNFICSNLIAENHPTSDLTAYPNPCYNILTIEEYSHYEFLNIYSVDGRLIRKLKLEKTNKTQLDLQFLESGLYLLVANSSTKKSILKIVKI